MGSSDNIIKGLRRRLAHSRYLRDVFVQASGNTGAQLVGIVAMPALTRLYAPADFAVLNLFSQVVAGLTILMTLRFEYLVLRPIDDEDSGRVLALSFRLGAIHVAWMTPLLAVLPEYWLWLRRHGELVDWLWLAPVSAWAFSLAVGLQQAVQRHGDFRTSAISEFLGRCAYVTSSLVGALALPNIVGLILSALANGGGKIAWLFRASRVQVIAMVRSSISPIPSYIHRLAWSTSVSNMISFISGFAPMLFISDRYGADALGQYGLVVATLYLPTALLGQAIGQVYYQRACELQREGADFTSTLIETSRSLVKVGLPVYLIVAVVSPVAYPVIFGIEWESAGEIARCLCIAAVAAFISTPLDRTSIVANVWWYLSAWHSLRAAMTALSIHLATILGFSLEGFVLILSLQNALTYGIDWIASYIFAVRSGKKLKTSSDDAR